MFAVFTICLWGIWLSRNKEVMDEAEVEGLDEARLNFQWASDYLARFHEVQVKGRQCRIPQQVVKWSAPGLGR